ncbi:MAG: DNA double-strand break repair nuclease NurA [Methanothermobacter wolfeii]|nr:DNA double-strand break repair nuclease NurA [Methanothermobacter wolfeii]
MNVLEEIADSLKGTVRCEIGRPVFRSSRYEVHEFRRENFRPLRVPDDTPLLAFIDGGNSPVITGPSFSVQLNRVAAGIFRGERRENMEIPSRLEFLSLMRLDAENSRYTFNLHPLDPSYREILPDEDRLQIEIPMVEGMDPSNIQGLPRRFAEWTMALELMGELGEGDILVTDGSLQASFENENPYIHELMEEGERRGVYVAGFSKTCSLYTTTSASLLGTVRKLAERYGAGERWCYSPVAVRMDRPTVITVVKLNPAGRIFRLDILGEDTDESPIRVASGLLRNSADACFPGYPYGLVDVDMRARVSRDEIEIYRRRILAEIPEREILKDVVYEAKSLDFHDELNRYAGEY